MASPPSGVETPTSEGPSPSDLVERTGELGALASLIDEARHGGGRLALIEGPAGIGKTRLLVEARALADARGMRVLTARGSELEREFSFGVVRQLFESALADPVEREVAFAGAASCAASVLGAFEDDGPGAAADASFAALHGLYWLALNMSAERPLMLAIDDLHWCDRPSLRFVAYLVRRLEDVPILVGTTLRTGEQATDMALLAEITHDPSEVSVRPGPLSEPAVLGLVRSRLGEDAHPDFCAACYDATGGNPLLLRQLLRALEADNVRPDAGNAGVVIDIGPRAVSRTVLMRLARLPDAAIAVSRAVAVLGESADLPSISAMTGLTEADVAEATGALARSEILRPEHPLGFVHPLVRDAVYRELPAGERELYHARAAQVLQDAGWSSEQVAAQLLMTPRRGEDWVVATLQEAARFSESKGAPENAVAYLQRALEEPPSDERRPDVVFALGFAEALTDGRAAAEHLAEAWETLPDAPRRAIAANVLARTILFSGSPSAACAFIRRALDELPVEMRNERESLEAVEMISLYFAADDTSGLARLEQYRTAPMETTGGRMLTGLSAWHWANTGGSAEECAALARRALGSGELIAADNGLLSIPPMAVLALADAPDALEIWEPALADAHRRGSIYSISAIHLWRGFALLRRGELVEAEESLRLALAEFNTWGHGPYADLFTTGHLAEALVAKGDVPGARATLELAVDMRDDSDGSSFWGHTLAEVLIAEGRHEEAIEVSEDLGRRMGRILNPALAPWRTLKAQALGRLGRWDEAVALAEAELVDARVWGATGAVGRGLRILGTLEREDGLAHLEEAVAALTGSPARLQEAKALAAYGSALRRGRRPTDSREPLRRALELADICGAADLVEHVRSELYASGSRPRTTAMTGVEALTASERRVVTMAAAGQTNRDVAQALFVTPKTVEVHLSSAYRKLGVRSRRELAGALAGADGA